MRKYGPALIGCAMLFGGCSTDGTPVAAPDTPTTAVSTTAASTTARPAEVTTAPSTTAQQSEYAFTSTRVTGSTDRVVYDVTIPQLVGDDPAVVDEFNESIRAALQDQIDGFDDASFSLSDAPAGPTYVGPGAASAVLNTTWDANPPGAHPTSIGATVTVNTRTATPVTLQDLFPDLQTGLTRLSDESAKLLPSTAAGPEFDASGIEPIERNFANWVPSAAGMNIRFGDYQVGPHAIGLVDVTVPWSALTDVADAATLEALGG